MPILDTPAWRIFLILPGNPRLLADQMVSCAGSGGLLPHIALLACQLRTSIAVVTDGLPVALSRCPYSR